MFTLSRYTSVCLLACSPLQATVLNLIAITESPAAFISPLITFNNSINQTLSCEDGRRSDSPEFCSVYMEEEGSPYFHVVFRKIQLDLSFKRTYWITGKNSELSLENKFLLYETILRPIWAYEIPLWGPASQSNIEILQRFQNKVLGTIVNAPRYVPNSIPHADLSIPTIREEVTNHSVTHKDKLRQHPNQLIPILLEE